MQTFLEKYYNSDDTILLGCSAGPDSMYILYQILETSFAKNLVVGYFNHKTRPETDDEEAFLENLAKQKGFAFESAECDFEKIQALYPSKSFEELAREKRYQFFDALMNIYHTKYVITAHHLDDKIETFFFHMLRGSKLSGLTNMKECHGGILRPLLHTEKKEILSYLDTHNLEYKIDETNHHNIHTRNKIRNTILPKCEEVKPEYRKNMQNLMGYFENMQAYIDGEVERFLNLTPQPSQEQPSPPTPLPLGEGSSKRKQYFEIPDFKGLSGFLQKEVIRYIYYVSNNHSTIGLSESNIAEVLKFIDGKNNKTIKEIRQLKLKKDGNKIYWR
ncbi:tRNA lysidine(34) synthetase TilS [Candidatus Gracilibacteria bacterium]|nr:tRNA lysidine(34) synthetase TilS [Candidatus Gracilibacteria bacterium]